MLRLFSAASAAALILAACSPGGEVAPPAGPDETGAQTASLPADLGSPVEEVTSESFNGRAVVDPQIAAFDPQLAAELMARAREALEEMRDEAARDEAGWHAGLDETGEPYPFRPYEMEVRHNVTAQAGGYLSVQQDIYLNAGGAHPNYFLGGAVYGQEGGGPVPVSSIVADAAQFGALLKAGLVEAKIQRGYGEEARDFVTGEVEDLLGEDEIAGAEWGQSYVLNASTEPGLFGGITVLFSPYDVGPYAEGSYEITIPASELSGLLMPAWAGRFGGDPVLFIEGP